MESPGRERGADGNVDSANWEKIRRMFLNPPVGDYHPSVLTALLLLTPWLRLTDVLPKAEIIRNPAVIELAAPGSELLLRWGFAVPEQDPSGERFVWADHRSSRLRIAIARPTPLRAVIRMRPLNGMRAAQHLDLRIGNRRLGGIDLAPGEARDYRFDIPQEALRYGFNEIDFRWKYAARPDSIHPESKDSRHLAAAVSSIRFEPRPGGRLLHPGDPSLEGSALLIPANQAMAFYLRVPRGARLRARLSRSATRSARFASGLVRVSVKRDDAPERILFVRAIGGVGRMARPLDVDLSADEGRIVRLSIRVEASDDGFVARFEDPRIDAFQGASAPEEAFGDYLEERTIGPSLVGTAADGALIYLMDALRACDLGCYGASVATSPHLDRLSRRGLLLERNTSQAPNTPPSVKAILTGRYLPYTGNNALPDAVETLGDVFKSAGFATGAFSNSPWPAAVGALQGIETVGHGLLFREGVPKLSAGAVTNQAADWVSSLSGRKFFAYLHTIHPHNPYTPPLPFRFLAHAEGTDGGTKAILARQQGERMTSPRDAAALRRLYQADILYNDHEFGRLAAKLRSQSRWNATAIAVIADHGDEFLEHGGFLHGWTSFSEMIQVPVILAGPSLLPGLVSDPTQSIDIAPTLLRLMGIKAPASMEGLAIPRPQARRYGYSSASSVPGILTIVAPPWKYVYAPRNGKEVGIGEGIARVRRRFFLYRIDADAAERRNVVASHPVTAVYLHRAIRSWLEKTAVSAEMQAGHGCAGCTPEQKKVLEDLGYLE